MATHWDKVWEFKTARFAVKLECAEEILPDLSWDETGEIQEKINSGELYNFTFRVCVYLDGARIGSDYLGNSIYANPADFRDHIGLAKKSREDGRDYGSYFRDMAQTAIEQARKHVAEHPAPKLRH